MIPESQRDDGFPPALRTAAFDLLSPANLTVSGYTDEFNKQLEEYQRSAVPLVVLLNSKHEDANVRIAFQARSRDAVNAIAAILVALASSRVEMDDGIYGEQCYGVFFEDLDGNRLEVCVNG